jgi:hypothetical protein
MLPPPVRDGLYLEIANAGEARPIVAIGNARPIAATKAIAPGFNLLIIDLLLTRTSLAAVSSVFYPKRELLPLGDDGHTGYFKTF